MSGEVWQFFLIGGVGLTVALLWLFIIYLPRWTAEGEGDGTTSPTGEAGDTEDPEERN